MVGVHEVVVARIIDVGSGGDGRVVQVVVAVVVAPSTPAVGHPWDGDRVVGAGTGHCCCPWGDNRVASAGAGRRHCPGGGDGRCSVVVVVVINAGGGGGSRSVGG